MITPYKLLVLANSYCRIEIPTITSVKQTKEFYK